MSNAVDLVGNPLVSSRMAAMVLDNASVVKAVSSIADAIEATVCASALITFRICRADS